MYPIETITDFSSITELIVIGVAFSSIIILTVFLISWGIGMGIKFFKELAK